MAGWLGVREGSWDEVAIGGTGFRGWGPDVAARWTWDGAGQTSGREQDGGGAPRRGAGALPCGGRALWRGAGALWRGAGALWRGAGALWRGAGALWRGAGALPRGAAGRSRVRMGREEQRAAIGGVVAGWLGVREGSWDEGAIGSTGSREWGPDVAAGWTWDGTVRAGGREPDGGGAPRRGAGALPRGGRALWHGAGTLPRGAVGRSRVRMGREEQRAAIGGVVAGWLGVREGPWDEVAIGSTGFPRWGPDVAPGRKRDGTVRAGSHPREPDDGRALPRGGRAGGRSRVGREK
ncbi:hypothetical protein CF166_27275 [Amycolatopsis sp. KNN50.9b]|nr:hypothetical protein CF166_27275 [Amycolatopsis sp. KNN50.9b]